MLTQTMKLFLFSCVIIVVQFAPSAICNADSFEVSVVVVNSAGEPVAEAVVSRQWDAGSGKLSNLEKKNIIKTDTDGKATFELDIYGSERPVLIMSKDQKLGAACQMKPENATEPLKVTLKETIKVSGKVVCEDVDPNRMYPMIYITPGNKRGMAVVQSRLKSKFDLVLPPGEYAFFCYGPDLKKTTRVFKFKPGEDRELDPIEMEASTIVKLRGKPAPDWVIKEARGVEKSVKISDYKGKWVLLEFWGYW